MSDNNSSSSSSSSGIGFFGLLTVLFIALKLLHVINWPWIWVLAPLWGGLALALVIVLLVLLFAFASIMVRNK